MRQKIEIALIGLLLAALCFSLGFFFGRSSTRQVSVSLSRTSETATAAAQTEADAPRSLPQTEPAQTEPAQTETAEPKPVQAETAAPEYPLDLNKATAAELETLPGIGPTLAQRIVDYREANGAFRSLTELTKVRGIGEKTLAAILDYLKVEEP